MTMPELTVLIDRWETLRTSGPVLCCWAPENEDLYKAIASARLFRCSACGNLVSYFDLERWCSDLSDPENGCVCGLCFEEMMGEGEPGCDY